MPLKIYHIVLLQIILLCGCAKLFQSPIDADTAFRTKQYNTAAELLTKQYGEEKNPLTRSHIAARIAECYRLSNQIPSAEVWYTKAIEYSDDPELTFKYAQILKTNGKYDAAMKLFKEYALSKPSERAKASAQIQACKQALEWQKQTTNYKIRNLQGINSPNADFAPMPYMDDQLVFTSDRKEAKGESTYGWTGKEYSDLFVAKRQRDNTYINPIQFGDSINTDYNEGVVSFSSDYQLVYFTACGSASVDQDDYCQIYLTHKNQDGKWVLPSILMLYDTDTINVGQAYLAFGGKQLFFSTDAPGGFGGKDLYYVELQQNGKWSDPRNLGPEINTDGYEGFPYISPDGKLYFASNGHLGMGGLDVFVATQDQQDHKWHNPQNLKTPINSPADDFGLVFEPFLRPEIMDSIEQIGYFSSTRPGGKGGDDIYQFIVPIAKKEDTPTTVVVVPLPPKVVETVYMLQVSVKQKLLTDAENPNSVVIGMVAVPDAIVQVLGLDAESSISKRLVANSKGLVSLPIEKETDYRLSASQADYFAQSTQLTTKGKSKLAQNDTVWIRAEMVLDKIFQRKEIVLENIYYDLDKSDIREDAQPTLNNLAKILRENPNIRIELASHTDSRGSDKYNLTLSQQRAQAAVNYLVSQGIEAARMIARGYGETQLVNRCANDVDCPEEEHQQNRRTTFKVIATNYQTTQ